MLGSQAEERVLDGELRREALDGTPARKVGDVRVVAVGLRTVEFVA